MPEETPSRHQQDSRVLDRQGDRDVRGNQNASSYTGDGSLLVFTIRSGVERSDTPADPPAGSYIHWMDSTTGDILGKVTNTAGTTKSYVIADFSAL